MTKKKIYKYELPVNGDIVSINDCIVDILSLQEQNGTPTMWATVYPDNKVIDSTDIIAIGTGWEIPEEVDKYLGTIQDKYGYVWHYFTIKAKTIAKEIEHFQQAYEDLKGDAFAVLAQAFGKMGITTDEASKAFDMRGLFDACM